MMYRGFRIADETTSPARVTIVIYETCRGHWRRVATANAVSAAETLVDQTIAARERLFGMVGQPRSAAGQAR